MQGLNEYLDEIKGHWMKFDGKTMRWIARCCKKLDLKKMDEWTLMVEILDRLSRRSLQAMKATSSFW